MKRFKNTLQTLKSSSFFRRILFSFIFTFSIIFFIFFFILTGFSARKYKEDKIHTNDQQALHSLEVTDNLLKNIYTNVSSMFTENQSLLDLIYGQQWSDTSQIKAIHMIDTIQSSSSYIHSVYLINNRLDKVMTNFQFYNTENFFDQELLRFLEETEPSLTPVFYTPRHINRYASYDNVDRLSYEAVWSLIFHSSQAGAMVINIDSTAFSNLLDTSPQSKASFYLLNNENQVMLSDNNEDYGTVFSNKALLDKMNRADRTSGHFLLNTEGKKYTVSYSKDSSLGIAAVKMEPYTILDSVRSLLGVSFGFSLLYILIGLVLSILVAAFLYKPVDLLKTSILQELPELPKGNSRDDFSMLSSVYHSIMSKNNSLAKYKDAYLSQFQEHELTKFLQGSSAAIGPESYTELSMLFPEDGFCIVLIDLDTQKSTSGALEGKPDDIALVMFSISNIADEIFSSACTFRKMESSYSCLTYILNFQEQTPFPLEEKLTQLHDLINQHFHVSFSIGTSSVVKDLDDLPQALSEAESSLNQRFVHGFNSIHIYNPADQTSSVGLAYPFELENEIISSLKSFSPQKVKGALDKFFAVTEGCPYSQIHLYLMWLNYNIQRFEYLNQLEPSLANLDSAHTLPEIRSLLESKCLSIIQLMEDKKNNGSERKELLEKLEHLIEKNLCNPNLSVIYLASEVHLSVNYLRSIYKEQTGDSLSNHIAEKKMQMIYDLLLDTDMNIQDISDKMGFTTKNYFFTFFKKHAGMTPSQYRSLHKK